MTHNIIKFPSGFYGLITNSGTIVNAALIQWDGFEGGYSYNTDSDNLNYYIAADRTVYYTNPDGTDARIWCAGPQLRKHLHRLAQIRARR